MNNELWRRKNTRCTRTADREGVHLVTQPREALGTQRRVPDEIRRGVSHHTSGEDQTW